MKMNTLEKFMVNNPVRSTMLRVLTHRLFRNIGDLRGKRVLEIGCGQGAGTESLLHASGAERVFAFDYDPDQVRRACKRLRRRDSNEFTLFLADGELLPFPDNQFDVVVEFAILHHMHDWRQTLREVARVLKPGGLFAYEEFLVDVVGHPLSRIFLVHPESGIFTAESLYEGMDDAGLVRHPGQRRLRQWWLTGTAERAL